MRADGVAELGALARQHQPDAVEHQDALLLDRLRFDEAHRRPPDRLADRFGVGGVIFLTLDVRFDVSGRHQPHVVAERQQFARPVVRSSARLDADQAARQFGEERQQPAARQPLAQNHLSFGVDAVHLKNRLGNVETNRRKLSHGRLSLISVVTSSATTLWHSDAGWRAVHSIRSVSTWRSSQPCRSNHIIAGLCAGHRCGPTA